MFIMVNEGLPKEINSCWLWTSKVTADESLSLYYKVRDSVVAQVTARDYENLMYRAELQIYVYWPSSKLME